MPQLSTPLPVLDPNLQIRPLAAEGQYVAKHLTTSRYFHFAEEEHFLLANLDGQQSAESLRAAYERRFQQSLSEEELRDFLGLAQSRGLLKVDVSSRHAVQATNTFPARRRRGFQSILYLRIPLFDPNRFCNWLEPHLRGLWTRGFLFVSACAIVLAAAIALLNSRTLVTHFTNSLHWQAFALLWFMMAVTTTVHEFAHGLTCKHYGGDVHEMGFLLLFFIPCFYCNVSDVWLFPEKSKRLWVMLAGAYIDLLLCALAVIVWRLTATDNLVNYASLNLASLCAVRTFFNLNPLLKLDGYYLLSDYLEVPNLQSRALNHFKAQVRRLFWGAPQSESEMRGHFLFTFGVATWTYSIVLLCLMMWGLLHFVEAKAGWIGIATVATVGLVSNPNLTHGFADGELRQMIRGRPKRTAAWVAIVGGAAAILGLVSIEDCANGSFVVRSRLRVEVRAPASGFVKSMQVEQGEQVSAGALISLLEVPELPSRISQQKAAIHEAEAKLRLLQAGTRKEELEQQRARVQRMTAWRDLAKLDLIHARQALQQELTRLDQQVAQHRAELAAASDAYQRAKNLSIKGVLTAEERREVERRHRVVQSQLAQAESQKRQREALGTREAIAGLDAEAELARREKDLADAEATFSLLNAGPRPEELDAARAGLARLNSELQYLEGLLSKLAVASPMAGIISTSRMKEMVGQYLNEGDLIAVIEEPSQFEIEIDVAEQEMEFIHAGQRVTLKARALPFETFASIVDRIAPSATRDQVQSKVTIYCRIDDAPPELRSQMSGHARIYTGRRTLGSVVFHRAIRFLRTELWW